MGEFDSLARRDPHLQELRKRTGPHVLKWKENGQHVLCRNRRIITDRKGNACHELTGTGGIHRDKALPHTRGEQKPKVP
jgi:hypothetical protein